MSTSSLELLLLLFLCSFVSLISLITETFSRTSIVSRLKSHWLLIGQESHACFSFPRTSYLFCLHLENIAVIQASPLMCVILEAFLSGHCYKDEIGSFLEKRDVSSLLPKCLEVVGGG